MPNVKSDYTVKKPFNHEHVVYPVDADISLSERQAQHLLLGGFIVKKVADKPVAKK